MSSHEPVRNVGVGASASAPVPSLTDNERIMLLLANLMAMQQVLTATQQALLDILVAKDILSSEDLDIINKDAGDAFNEFTGNSVPEVE